MKLLLFAFALGFSAISFADTVSGPKAEALYDALKANGVKLEVHTERSELRVKNVSCTMNESSECTLFDELAKKKLKLRDSETRKVTKLVNALNNAGADLQSRPFGYTIDANSVKCVGFYHAGPHRNCEVNN